MRLMHYRWLLGSAAAGLRFGLTMLCLFFGWWDLLSKPLPRRRERPVGKSQTANSSEKVDPVKQEYEALLVMDEDAMDEIDAWIRQAGEESLQQQDGSSIRLPALNSASSRSRIRGIYAKVSQTRGSAPGFCQLPYRSGR